MEFIPALNWLLSRAATILLILIVAFWGYWLFSVFTRRLTQRIQALDKLPDSLRDKRTETIYRVINNTGLAFIVTSVLLLVLQQLGIQIMPLLAGIGVVGLALGLGAQTLVKDIISGLFILVENQYNVGETVTLVGKSGLVEEMTLRTTQLRDSNGLIHIIPNGDVRLVSNHSRGWSLAVAEVPLNWERNVQLATQILQKIGEELANDETIKPFIGQDRPAVTIQGLQEGLIQLRIALKTLPTKQGAVQNRLLEKIQQEFVANGLIE